MPIALRLFLTVLLTTLVITTLSLGVLHWTMQKNFARYVADVEMQKLDHLITNLGNVYSVYHDWGNAIQAQILQIEGDAAPDDYDRLSRWWLRRQYDIALQQRMFKEQTLLSLSPELSHNIEFQNRPILDEQERKFIAEHIHDAIGQQVTGIKIDLTVLKNKIQKIIKIKASRKLQKNLKNREQRPKN